LLLILLLSITGKQPVYRLPVLRLCDRFQLLQVNAISKWCRREN